MRYLELDLLAECQHQASLYHNQDPVPFPGHLEAVDFWSVTCTFNPASGCFGGALGTLIRPSGLNLSNTRPPTSVPALFGSYHRIFQWKISLPFLCPCR
jgi:hypothetical protein